MIENLTLRNYRGHTATTFACGRLTVLVGENATGKTSVLRAVQSISEGIMPTRPASDLHKGADELGIVLTGQALIGPFRIEAAYGPATAAAPDPTMLVQRQAKVLDDAGGVGFRPHAIFLAPSAQALAAPSVSKRVVPVLDPSGSGLASVLAYLKLAETARFERILQRLRAVVPIFKGIGFERVAARETVPRMIRVEDRQVELADTVEIIQDGLVLDFTDAERVPASVVSEGTLVTLGMLTALELFDREREAKVVAGVMQHPVEVVLIDDIDRALHPRAQRELVATLRAALDATPDLQILATSHSPYLVDALRTDEVVVLGRDAGNVIVAKRLDEFPDERLRKMLSTGELWISEGDSWASR